VQLPNQPHTRFGEQYPANTQFLSNLNGISRGLQAKEVKTVGFLLSFFSLSGLTGKYED
jgi:hypothetical protein